MRALAGVVAVVTGGSRGIGRGIALGLGEAGAIVYVTGRTIHDGTGPPAPGTIQETAAEVTRLGGRGVAVRCDHACDGEVAALFERVDAERGRLDLLVNNATSFPPGGPSRDIPFWELPLAAWDEPLTVGLRSHYVASSFAARRMVAERRGKMVNISSFGAVRYVFNVAYGVGKAGVERLSADIAHELRPYGVAVVAVRPVLHEAEMIGAEPRREVELRDDLPLDTGRVIAAFAADSDALSLTGRVLTSVELAKRYRAMAASAAIPESKR